MEIMPEVVFRLNRNTELFLMASVFKISLPEGDLFGIHFIHDRKIFHTPGSCTTWVFLRAFGCGYLTRRHHYRM